MGLLKGASLYASLVKCKNYAVIGGPVRVLGIETSCDETGVALYDSSNGSLVHELYSQWASHAPFGGVVPELASRDHIRKALPLIRVMLAKANLDLKDLDGVAYTVGPGLIGALLVGAALGRSLAWALGVPAVGVHHMEGHLLAPLLEKNSVEPPFLALLVSGGHTLLIRVAQLGSYEILGETLDDAVGEAFDKTAKLLGLPYPGGPALAALAAQGRPGVYQFPRPMTQKPGLDFSFSGLKTCVLTQVQQCADLNEQARADIAWAFQEAAVETLVIKCLRALKTKSSRTLVVAGGVGANHYLRTRLAEEARLMPFELHFPRPEFCTDNGAMIAFAGYLRLKSGEREALKIYGKARWPLTDLAPMALS